MKVRPRIRTIQSSLGSVFELWTSNDPSLQAMTWARTWARSRKVPPWSLSRCNCYITHWQKAWSHARLTVPLNLLISVLEHSNGNMATQVAKRVIVVTGWPSKFFIPTNLSYLPSCRLGKRIWNGGGNCVSKTCASRRDLISGFSLE